jgi:YegS/Rv2252/BmrU family lipid kinase
MEDIVVILNPTAHSDRARDTWARIQALPGARLLPTAAPGDASRLAREQADAGRTIVVAAGGDGTINEVANGLAGSGTALGVLPVGTMNVFASELGLPTDLEEAWDVICAGYTRQIDLAKANGQYFVQLAGVGIDALVVERTTREFKRNFGPLSYLFNAAQVAAQKPPRLIVQSEEVTREGSFVLIGNGRYYGAPIKVFKDARLDDGKLDVLVMHNLGYLDIIRYLTGVMTGMHTIFDDVEYFQTPELTVTSSDDVPVEVDGELAGKLPVRFTVAPCSLKVTVDYS